MQNGQRTSTKEFQGEAVKLAQTSGKSMTQVAQDLGVSDSRLSRWCQQSGEHGAQAFPGSGHQLPEQEELRRLKREREGVRMERDLLKKALAIFSHLPQEHSSFSTSIGRSLQSASCVVFELSQSAGFMPGSDDRSVLASEKMAS